MSDKSIEVPEERISPRSIEREMKESYLTYALSVIHSRALPDVRDGLKPSQRRILVAMNDLNLGPRAKYRKCAKVAGDTSGNYHPHGEAVIYPTLVRMAQDFSLRYPLIDGQGNFGSIDGDPPAAMRYTESRMAGIATELMADLDRDTVEYEPNYDESRTQPTVLPSRFPNLLCNGSDGIAVGMATSLPPHNLREVATALGAILENPDVELSELIKMVPGPDFPTGGIVMGPDGLSCRDAGENWKSSISNDRRCNSETVSNATPCVPDWATASPTMGARHTPASSGPTGACPGQGWRGCNAARYSWKSTASCAACALTDSASHAPT